MSFSGFSGFVFGVGGNVGFSLMYTNVVNIRAESVSARNIYEASCWFLTHGR